MASCARTARRLVSSSSPPTQIRFDNRTSHCNRGGGGGGGGVSLTSFDRNRHFSAHHIPPEMETARWSDISFECQSHTVEPDEYKRINLKIGGWLASLAYIWPEQPTTLSRRKPISPLVCSWSVFKSESHPDMRRAFWSPNPSNLCGQWQRNTRNLSIHVEMGILSTATRHPVADRIAAEKSSWDLSIEIADR